MLKYNDHKITRRGRFLYVDGEKREITECESLYEKDRAGVKARGGAKGLYKLLKECQGNDVFAQGILNGIMGAEK